MSPTRMRSKLEGTMIRMKHLLRDTNDNCQFCVAEGLCKKVFKATPVLVPGPVGPLLITVQKQYCIRA